jgi:D-sedoheptulose 7-phosphate isomerase
MKMKSIFLKNLEEHQAIFEKLGDLDGSIEKAIKLISSSLESDSKLMVCGNGGSAADSQHIAAEFTGRFIKDRKALASIALTTDTSAITCIANDYSFNEIFSRQISGLGRKGDCLLAISTSGNSNNVIKAVHVAKSLGISTIGMLGRDGGNLLDLCDVTILVESESTARIQEAHILIAHSICGGVETRLGLV